MDIIDKLTKPFDLVVNPCAGTFSVGMECMLLPKHRIIDGCDKDDSCLDHSTSPLVALLDRYFLNPNSDVDSTDNDRLHDIVLLRELDEIEIKRRMDIWDIPDAVPMVHAFQSYLRHFL